MKRYLQLAAGLLVLLSGLGIYLRHQMGSASGNSSASLAARPAILPPTAREQVLIDTVHHTITEVTRNAKGQTESKRSFLGTGTTITESVSGAVKVQTDTFGTELSPSLGVLYGSDLTMRGAASLGLLHLSRYEVGVGLCVGSSASSARAFVSLTYNVRGNVLLGVYADNHKEIGGMATLKLF